MSYDTITHFFKSHGICHRDQDKWRLTKPCQGAINGLEKTFRGNLVATNGILCYIETSAGVLLQGHFDWFVKDPKEEAPCDRDGNQIVRVPKAQTLAEDLVKYLNL